ncbi:hypothetical protein [Streptomyces umbrinus]|uniref:hypothetical protein n=1 Tax=Streptomyces umbrinus TaxID=67370 RepID=UPI00342A0664
MPVTPGLWYWSCASIFPPHEWAWSRILIRWYTAGGTLISTTEGPRYQPPTRVWHQVGAIGQAPATAATADVIISVEPTSANQTWFADRVFLGLPATTFGNLLPWNMESLEIDIESSWTNIFPDNWGVTKSPTAYAFFQSMLLTSQGAGRALVISESSQAVPVTAGVEYVAYAYVTPGVSYLQQRTQIYWINAAGAEIGISSADWYPPTGQWTRCTVIGVAPPGAVKARVGLAPLATAAGQQWAFDRIVLAPTGALMTAGNILPYNVSDMEQDVTGWSVTGADKSQTTEQVLGGAYAMKLVGTGGDIVVTSTVYGVQPGVGYQFVACTLKPGDRVYQTRIEWLNSAGEPVRTRWQSWAGSTGVWLAGAMGDLAPDDAETARISFIVPNAPVGEVWYFDRAEWRIGGLTARAVPAGGGGAAVTVRGLTSGGPTWKWSLTRIVAGDTPQPVRGWTGDITKQSITGDVAVITDYEAPLGVDVQWRVTIENPTGSGRYSYTSDAISLDSETLDVWLKDPGLPARSVRATVQTLPDWQRSARQGVNQVRGRSRPIVISDVRSSRTGSLALVTHSESERDSLWWVLDTGHVLLLQWPPGWGERDTYVSIGDVTEAHITELAEFSDRTWTLALTEVDRPFGGIVGSADRTWQTVAESGADWSDALAGATTWLDVYTGVAGG